MRTHMHHQWRQTWIAAAFILAMTGPLTIRAEEAAVKLPDDALAALNARYRNCTIQDVEVERERNIRVFAVTISLPGRVIEAEITGDGNIVETEEKVAVDAVPAALKAEISKLTTNGHQVAMIEKHEILCAPCLGAFRQLAKPILFYDLKTRDGNGARRSVLFEQDADRFIPKAKAADDDDDDDDDDDND